jgi:hypothetical protein
MPNEQISDFTALGATPAPGDLLAIVDVSDTTEAATGTTKKITFSNLVGPGGLGDVVGPSSSVDSEIALFNSTTGKLLKRATQTGLLKAASGVLSAAVAGTDYSVPTASVNAQTGTTYTLLASDNGKIVTCSNASPITVTVPSGLGAGFNCLVIQKGAGQITFSPSSTTINNRQSHTKSAGQHALCTLAADVADNFYLGGDTSA